MSYQLDRLVYTLRDYDSHSSYDMYQNVYDASNDYNRILNAIDKGAFIISGCRSKFEDDTIEGIKAQLDKFNVSYTEDELKKLDSVNCDEKSGIYQHLLKRYNSKTTKDLENDLKRMGYGFRASYGGYQENQSSTPEKEFSFFVPYIESKTPEEFQNDLLELINKYLQDTGFLIHPQINNGKAHYLKGDKDIDTEFSQKYPNFKRPEDKYFTETRKTNSKPFSYRDSAITKENLAKDLSSTKLLITSQFSHLRSLYDEDGWSKTRK